MKIIKAGTKVITKIGNIECFVVGVCISEQTVEYKCRWFAGGEEKSAWLYRYEIEVIPTNRKAAGFGKKHNGTEVPLIEIIE